MAYYLFVILIAIGINTCGRAKAANIREKGPCMYVGSSVITSFLGLFSSLINRLIHYSVMLLSASTFANDILKSHCAGLPMNVPEREVLRGGYKIL